MNDDLAPAALLWDMDGTLVDTEPYWMLSETELITAHGGSWTHEDALQVVGMGLWDAAEIFRAKGVDLPADQIVTWMTDRVLEQIAEEVPWRPGARELLLECKDAGIPAALVTMSVHRMAEAVATAIGFDAFEVIVGGDDVEKAKPDPDPYLRAAALLGVDAADCVAFEDSVPGVAAAASSGAVTIALPLHTAIAESDRYTIWDGLGERSLDDVRALFRSRRRVATA